MAYLDMGVSVLVLVVLFVPEAKFTCVCTLSVEYLWDLCWLCCDVTVHWLSLHYVVYPCTQLVLRH